jgi:mannose-1-phosphate guanylyltransferase
VLDVSKGSVTIKVTLNPGSSMNYHSHERRDESWTVTSGEGIATLDGQETKLTPGCSIEMTAGVKHTVRNTGSVPLELIEIQLGDEIDVRDKIKW